jgi:hypothetical protein
MKTLTENFPSVARQKDISWGARATGMRDTAKTFDSRRREKAKAAALTDSNDEPGEPPAAA